ncbi:P-loop NTPase fold protein [Aliarcobacter cryaerophilus]|uniref:P-loop NTPase fold protein n=1 Tax=Aliarcobacter cryaerophilus TaxID=28198 RepID=UPI0008244568|nr:P-loop NTPase fold protein [Aliarcobacter cryaerophilus]
MKNIENFLNYYINLENPQYAVLLKGKWGSGKTYFINEYKKKLDEKQKYIYVSLYGVTSYDEIETKFLQSSNPEIFNEKSIFVGKLANAFINEKVKKSLGEVKKAFSSFNLKGNILIFDDLERCNIDIVALLGYINNFVEHQAYKVILIANEEELDKTDKYQKIKEKLIGKTFEFISNTSLAYDSFLSELKNENKIKEEILEKFKSNILDIFEKANFKNLRILRQTLLDFERFYDEVLVNHQLKKELIKDILYWFFMFSFEIKQGNTNIKNETNKIKEKYGFDYKLENILDDFWENILLNSNIEKDKIEEALKNSKHYFDENTPSWKKLSRYYNLEDEEFEKLLKDVYEQFCKNNYKEYKQFKLIASMLLFFQENSLLDIKLEILTDVMKNNFKQLFEKNTFKYKDIYSNNDISFSDKHYHNIEYLEGKNFNIISDFIDSFLKEKELETLKDDMKLIIEYIEKKDGKSIFNLLEGYNNIYKFDYKNRPILEYIEIDDLFNALLKTNGTTMYYLGGIIKDRYTFGTKLISEKTTLKSLLDKIDKHLEKNQGKLSSYNLKKEVKENIEIALKCIEDIETSENKV